MRCSPALLRLVAAAAFALQPCLGLANPPPAQYLPVAARWCLAQGCIELEVPKSQEQYQRGLMQRPALGAWQGMWFRFNPAQPVSFWMHQCLAPLDLVFVREGRVVDIKADLPPCPRLPCPTYRPAEPVDGVVELKAGRAAELGLTVGSPAAPTLDSKAPIAAPRPGAPRG